MGGGPPPERVHCADTSMHLDAAAGSCSLRLRHRDLAEYCREMQADTKTL